MSWREYVMKPAREDSARPMTAEEEIRDRHLREDGVYQYINHTGISRAWEESANKLKTSPLLKEENWSKLEMSKIGILAVLAADYSEDPYDYFITSAAMLLGMTKVALMKYEERLRAKS